MGDARTVLVSAMTTLFNYELRNTDAVQWTAAETLAYVNKWMEYVHIMMAEHECDMVVTGSGSFTTVEGTETYDLSANSMGDLWFPVHVWVSSYSELEQVSESERMSHEIAEEQSANAYSQPSMYYLEGDNIGLLPFPDDTYTIRIKYIPDYTALAVDDTMPFRNLFNNVLVEGVKVIAKNREEYGTAIDAALMQLFQDRAMSVIRKRQKQNPGFVL